MAWFQRTRNSWSDDAGSFDEEAQFHIDQRTEEFIRDGMSAEEARREARKRFGSVAFASDGASDANRFRWMDDFRRDLGYGLRMLRRNPGFSLLAVLCLTLGIGANAAVFSWIEGVMLRPYPLVQDEDSLFVIAGTAPEATKGTDISWPDFKDLERSSTTIQAFIADRINGAVIGLVDQKGERAPGSLVSANYFDALGVKPILGRGFQPGEDVGRNAHPVVVISYQLWQRQFASALSAVGSTIRLNGVLHTVVGVAPEGFYGTFVGYQFQFWVPSSMQAVFDPGGYKLDDRGARWIEGFVRVKPGVSRAQAQTELSSMAERLQTEFPSTNRGRGLMLKPLWQSPFNPMDALVPTLTIALVGVAAMLLIACANVGNLLLLKSVARRGELTIRLAVGAGRGRLIRQLLTEAILLSSIAGACGLVAAYWARGALVFLFPPRGTTPLRLPADLDGRVLVLSLGLTFAATVLFGLIPAMLASKVDLVGGLKRDSAGAGGGGARARVRATLVLVQVAISFVLIVGAGLVVESLYHMRTTSPGFDPDRVLVTYIDLAAADYDIGRANVFKDRLIERIDALPGIEAAAFVGGAPFSYSGGASAPVAVDGYETQPGEAPTVEYTQIGPAYLRTLGIPLVGGREFTRDDNETSELVAVVNQPMAARYWRGRDPVGSRLVVAGRPMRVVGVAKLAKYRDLLEPARPFFYVPLRQTTARGQTLMIRTTLAPSMMTTALTTEVRTLDGSLTPDQLMTMREQIGRMNQSATMAVRLLTAFGAVALILAAIGLYGVMSFTVTQNARELALRLALGADPSSLLRRVLGSGLLLTTAGMVCGAIAAFGLTRLLGTLLFEVNPRDPMTFALAFVAMAAASAVACVVPAIRATRTDPVQVLRA
jgi:putative ABC transport system permease protein